MEQTGSRPSSMLNPSPSARRAVNVRSVGLGLLGVVLISAITPFNNYVVNNNDLVGNALPVGVLFLTAAFVLLVNAPLHRFAPRSALGAHELAVVMGMMLVGCALPGVGLMRYLPGQLVSILMHGSVNGDYAELLRQVDPPDWIFPKTGELTSWGERGGHTVVQDYLGRIPLPSDASFFETVRVVPWSAWSVPLFTWGVFFAALFGATICMTLVFRRQWTENERLPFPLAEVCLSLIEPPPPGRAVNGLLRSAGFWVAFGVVFGLHGLNALHSHLPKSVPLVPLGYDLRDIFGGEPWKYTDQWIQAADVYFTIIGIVWFIQAKLSFSLWFFFLLTEVSRMVYGSYGQQNVTLPMEVDQMFGALIPVGATIVYIGRHELRSFLRPMFRRGRADDVAGHYLPQALTGWVLVACVLVLVVWLKLAGATLIGAVVIVLMLLLFYLVIARTVAETGLLYVLVPVTLTRPWIYLAGDMPAALTARTSMGSFFYAGWFSGMLTHDLRCALPQYSATAVRIADEHIATGEQPTPWRANWRFVAALALALAVAYPVAGASMVWCNYTFSSSLDRSAEAPLATNANVGMSKWMALDNVMLYEPPGTGAHDGHNRLGHFAFGATMTATLSALRLRFAEWPLHPLGFLFCYTWGVRKIWLSVLIGWVLKLVVLKLGGSALYARCRPVVLGMILGESGAVAFWLIVNLLLVWNGAEYSAVDILPNK